MFSVGMPATPSRKNGMKATCCAAATSRKSRGTRSCTRRRNSAAPPCRSAAQRCPAASPSSTMVSRFCRVRAGGSAPQSVVGAELDDENLDVARQRPVETRQPAVRGVARVAGIDHFVSVALALSRSWMSAGTASSLPMPRPAVRLSPRNTMRGSAATGSLPSPCHAVDACEAVGSTSPASCRRLRPRAQPSTLASASTGSSRHDGRYWTAHSLNYLILAVTPFTIDAGPLATAFTRNLDRLNGLSFADALWSKRLEVWTGDARRARRRLPIGSGWLDALAFITPSGRTPAVVRRFDSRRGLH